MAPDGNVLKEPSIAAGVGLFAEWRFVKFEYHSSPIDE
jgi:hypothetical protein